MTRARRPRALLQAAALLLALGCDPRQAAEGSWQLTTVDGVGPAVAAPLRVLFPAVTYGADTLAIHGMWHEVTLDSLALVLDEDGSFRARAVEAKRTLTRKNTFDRPDYVSGAFGGDLIRADARAETTETTGRWTLAGDSLVVTAPRGALLADLAARVRQALPGTSAADIQAALEAAVPAAPPPRWTGAVKGDRLELVDEEGRTYGFRRAGTR